MDGLGFRVCHPFRRRRPGARCARGMTLIEVLIASAILAFGMAGVLAALSTAFRSHKRALDETNAALVGASVMADLRGIFASGLVPYAIAENAAKPHADFPDYRYAVKLADLSAKRGIKGGPKLGQEFYVEVRVYWTDRGDAGKSSTFQTVMFLRNP